jgi:hypothetical protein
MLMRWEQGASWEATGIYEEFMKSIQRKGLASGCRTFADVVALHARYDRLFEQVQKERALRTREELGRGGFRALNGVMISFGRDLSPLFSWGGKHRLAAARIAGLEWIPVQLGVVHSEALTAWKKSAVRGTRRERDRRSS